MNIKKEIAKKTEMLKKSFEYQKKRIVFHENAHLIFAYFFGFQCKYIDYTIHSSVAYKDPNLEMEFNSKAHTYVDTPSFLLNYYVHLKSGGSPEQFSTIRKIEIEQIHNATIAHLTVLYSGYEAERFFFDKLKYWKIKRFIKRYSEDYTSKNIMEDETKAIEILTTLRFSDEQIKRIRKSALKKIRRILKEPFVVKIFKQLHDLSNQYSRLTQNQIETVLKEMNFDEVSNSIINKLNK